jgi:hypothetical protein
VFIMRPSMARRPELMLSSPAIITPVAIMPMFWK